MILTELSVPLGDLEYRLESHNEQAITYVRTHRPLLTIAIVLFPLIVPLLLLLVVQTDRVVLSLLEQPSGTRIVAVGDGLPNVRRQLEQLGDTGPSAE